MQSISSYILSLLVPLALITPAQIAVAENHTFLAEKYDFSVSYPPELQSVSTGTPMVALALRNSASAYPTFNIVVQAGRYDLSPASLHLNEKLLLESYGKIGLIDVKARKSGILKLPAGPALQAELDYSLGGDQMSSVVTILSGSSMHYILTWLDSSSKLEMHRATLQQILDSFQLLGAQAVMPVQAASGQTGSSIPVLWPAFVLGLLALSFLVYSRRRRRQ